VRSMVDDHSKAKFAVQGSDKRISSPYVECYYCHKQGHTANFCNKKLHRKIEKEIPSKYIETWKEIVERKRIPYGFVTIVAADNLKLLNWLKKYNNNRANRNPTVDKEIDELLMIADKKFMEDRMKKKENKKIDKVTSKIIETKIEKTLVNNMIPNVSKKIEKIIESKQADSITGKEVDQLIQQVKENATVGMQISKNIASNVIKETKKDARDEKYSKKSSEKETKKISTKKDLQVEGSTMDWEKKYKKYKPYLVGDCIYAEDGTFLDIINRNPIDLITFDNDDDWVEAEEEENQTKNKYVKKLNKYDYTHKNYMKKKNEEEKEPKRYLRPLHDYSENEYGISKQTIYNQFHRKDSN